MSAEVINFPEPPKGNGAPELVAEYVREFGFFWHPYHNPNVSSEKRAEHFLLWLGERGFVITQVLDE